MSMTCSTQAEAGKLSDEINLSLKQTQKAEL